MVNSVDPLEHHPNLQQIDPKAIPVAYWQWDQFQLDPDHDLEVGDSITLKVSADADVSRAVKFLYHIGPLNEHGGIEAVFTRASDQAALPYQVSLDGQIVVSIDESHLVNVHAINQHDRVGELAIQVVAVYESDPWLAPETLSLRPEYQSRVLTLDGEQVAEATDDLLAIHTNRRPYFGRPAHSQIRPEKSVLQHSPLVLAYNSAAELVPIAEDPERDPIVAYEYYDREANEWTNMQADRRTLVTTVEDERSAAGDQMIRMRATDAAGRVSKPYEFQWTLNRPPAPPTLEGPFPRWPVPGGQLRGRFIFTDPDGDAVDLVQLEVTGKGYSKVVQGSELQLDQLPAGRLSYKGSATDARGAKVTFRGSLDLADPAANEISGTPLSIVNSVGMRMVQIPAGQFVMGAPATAASASESDHVPHGVRITKPFFMATHEVTLQTYQRVMGRRRLSRSRSDGADLQAATGITWVEANKFCQLLNQIAEEQSAGRKYRLPTEAEWEYACRAGTATPYHVGQKLTARDANFGQPAKTGSPVTLAVGRFPPNRFGLYDMHGNVAEWCADIYQRNAYWQLPAQDPVWVAEAEEGTGVGAPRVYRGGSWQSDPEQCASAARTVATNSAASQNRNIGLRVVCELPDRPAVDPFADHSVVHSFSGVWVGQNGRIYQLRQDARGNISGRYGDSKSKMFGSLSGRVVKNKAILKYRSPAGNGTIEIVRVNEGRANLRWWDQSARQGRQQLHLSTPESR